MLPHILPCRSLTLPPAGTQCGTVREPTFTVITGQQFWIWMDQQRQRGAVHGMEQQTQPDTANKDGSKNFEEQWQLTAMQH
mmetsp:Transcript_241/g.394  ORF Transcript_241/g.394 Transcript_241/m.394 type:complete len:81 (-) Transcript_241:782-1024(-)